MCILHLWISLYIYINLFATVWGGRTKKGSYMFKGVLTGDLEHASGGILKTTKTTPGGRSATGSTYNGKSRKNVLHLGMFPRGKVALKRWWLYIYIYTHMYMRKYIIYERYVHIQWILNMFVYIYIYYIHIRIQSYTIPICGWDWSNTKIK